MEFTNKPYCMVEDYLDLCNNGGLIVPMYLSQADEDKFNQMAGTLGVSLVEFMNSLVPGIEAMMEQVIKDHLPQEMNV